MKIVQFASLILISARAFAQSGQSIQEFEQPESLREHSYLNHFYLRPSAGATAFNGNSLFTSGFMYGFEFLRVGRMDLGITSGLLYSSLGNAVTESTGNNNFVIQIPADITVAFGLDRERRLQIGPHIGANVIDNSGHIGTFGSSPTIMAVSGNQPAVNPYMNFGGDATWKISKVVDLALRYDRSFLSTFALHTVTLGVGFGIGFKT